MAARDPECPGAQPARPSCAVQICLPDGRDWHEVAAAEQQERIGRMRQGLWRLAETAIGSEWPGQATAGEPAPPSAPPSHSGDDVLFLNDVEVTGHDGYVERLNGRMDRQP